MNHSIYLFDFDYTLVNSEKGIVGCFHRTLKKYGLPDVPDQRLRRTIGLLSTTPVARDGVRASHPSQKGPFFTLPAVHG